jgi:hypothetical protein
VEAIIDTVRENPLAGLIALCEAGFWVLLGTGLLARYLLRLRRTSVVLLAGTPLLDVVLLVAAVLDLRRGGEASVVHGLGAAYLGFSVAFGHRLIRWADQRVAHRFAGGPPPDRPPRSGPGRVRHEWREWGRCVLACAIAAAVIGLLSLVAGSPERTAALWAAPGGWLPRLGLVTAIWFLAGPLWTMLSPRARDGERETTGRAR